MDENENTIIIEDESLKEGFTQLPRVVLKAQGLSMPAKTLYALLLDYAWQTKKCFPGQDRLAEDLNVHKNTIIKYLHELKDFGLITWIQRGFTKTNIYYIKSLNFLYERNVLNSYESQTDSKPELQTSGIQESQASGNIIKEELIDTDSNTTLTYRKKFQKEFNLNDFDDEAVLIAKELNDFKSLPYYQKLINRKNSGEVSDEQIQRALNTVREKLAIDKADGTNFWKKPGGMFVKALQKITKKDSKKRIDLTSIVESTKLEPMQRPSLLGLKNQALEQLKTEAIDSS